MISFFNEADLFWAKILDPNSEIKGPKSTEAIRILNIIATTRPNKLA